MDGGWRAQYFNQLGMCRDILKGNQTKNVALAAQKLTLFDLFSKPLLPFEAVCTT
jgi:hypothetical protein